MDKRDFIYKFMPFNKNALLTIMKHELYFASPNKLNDPIDCLHNIKIKNYSSLNIKDILPLIQNNRNFITWDDSKSNEQIAEDYLNDDQNLLGLIIHVIKEKNDKIGVCSFSNEKLDQRLWSHYGDSSKGICLVFDKEKLIKSLEINTRRQDSQFRRFYGKNVNYKGEPYDIEIVNGDFQIDETYFFKKTPDWEYEDEYRFVLFADSGMKDYSSYEKNRFFIYPVESLIGIIIGENYSDYDLQTIQDINHILGKFHDHRFKIKEIERNIKTGKINLVD
jgi:hypothetical protein